MPTISTLTVDVTSRTSGFSRGIKVATAGLAALAVGAAYAFNKFEESENVMQQTDAVLKSTGGSAKVTAGHVGALADTLSQLSGVDDETIQSGENMLLTFKNIRNEVGAGNDIFDQAATATLDLAAGYAAASGSQINMKSATLQLGKALNDPIAGMSSLTRVGVQFSEEQKHQIEQLVKHNNLLGAQKVILGEVTSQFQGSAEAQRTTAGEVSVAFENLAEVVGGVLAPAIRVLADGLTTFITWMQENVPPAWEAFKAGIQGAWDAIKPFAQTIGNTLIPLLTTAWHTIQDRIIPVLERLKPLFIVIGAAVVLFATMIVAQLALVVTAVGFVIDKFLDFVGFIRDKVVEPVVNFLGRIVSFVGDKLRPIWGVMSAVAVAAFHAILAPIQFVIDKVETLIGWVKSAIEWLGRLFAAGGAAADVSATTGRPGVGNIPGPETGGLVTRTGLATIHAGEVFSGVNNEMGFGGIKGDIVLQVDGQTFARITRDQLLKLGNRNAGTGL